MADGYGYIRMYEPNAHAVTALQVIREEKLPLQCMIGIDSLPEINSAECITGPQTFSDEELAAHAAGNIRPLRLPLSVTGVSMISTGRKNGKFAGIPLLRLQMVGLYNLVHHEPVVSVKAVSRVTDM